MEPIRLRPRTTLFASGIAAVLAFSVPTFTVLYYLAFPAGVWPAVMVANFVITLALAYAIIGYRRASIWLSPDWIVERGFFGFRHEWPTTVVGGIVRATVYLSGGKETAQQLFICDREGRQIVRMRGQYWETASMDSACEALAVPVTQLDNVFTLRELHEMRPGLLYWFERRASLATGLFVAALVLGGVGLYLLLYSLGETR